MSYSYSYGSIVQYGKFCFWVFTLLYMNIITENNYTAMADY